MVDMDLDGDKDIVAIDTLRDGFYTKFIIIENEDQNPPDLTLSETIKNSHVRSGSIYNLEWIGKGIGKSLDEGKKANISISYSGMDGDYHLLYDQIPRNWADIIIPDIPTQNAYIRIGFNGSYCYQGPLIIHNSEDRTTFMKSDEPESGSYLVGGEKDRIVLNASKYFPDGFVSVKLKTDNGTFDLGSHTIGPSEKIPFYWDVPDGIREDNCSLVYSYLWDGQRIEHEDDSVFSIIPSSEVPGSVISEDYPVPRNVDTPMKVKVLSRNGIDITAKCNYSFSGDLDKMAVYSGKNGSFSIRSDYMGNHTLNVTATRYDRSATGSMKIIVHRDISDISIRSNMTSYHTGDTANLNVTVYDHYGNVVDVSKDPLHIVVTGNGTIGSFIYPDFTVFCSSSGWIDINASLSIPYIDIFENKQLLVSSYFKDCGISSSADRVFVNDVVRVGVTMKKYDGLSAEGATVEWTINGPGETIGSTGNNIDVKALGQGNISVRAEITYLDEVVPLTKTIFSLNPPKEFFVEELPQWIEIGTESNYSFGLLDDTGSLYIGGYTSSVSTSDPSILSASMVNGSLWIHGLKRGNAELTISGTSYGRTIERSFGVQVLSIPRSLALGNFTMIKKGETIPVSIMVKDNIGDDIFDYGLTLNCSGVSWEKSGYTLRLTGMELGPGYVEVSINTNSSDLKERFDFKVIQWAERLRLNKTDVSFYQGGSVDIDVTLIDKERDTIPDAIISFEEKQGLDVTLNNNSLSIVSNIPGYYSLEIKGSYWGETFDGRVNVTVLEKRVLTEVILDHKDDDIYDILAYDQKGLVMTDVCTIEIVGDYDPIDHDTFMGLSGHIDVKVTYNGTTITKGIDVEGNDGQEGIPILAIAIPAVVMICIIAIAVLMYSKNKKGPMEE